MKTKRESIDLVAEVRRQAAETSDPRIRTELESLGFYLLRARQKLKETKRRA